MTYLLPIAVWLLLAGFIIAMIANKKFGMALAAIAVVLSLMLVSFMITCAFVKIITWCFGLAFSWKLAFGIWILAAFLRWVFGSSKKK